MTSTEMKTDKGKASVHDSLMTSTEMKTEKGKAMTESNFHTDNSWSPSTPQKPTKPSPTSIYLLDGQQVEAELRSFPEQTITAQTQTQTQTQTQSPIYESSAAPGYGLNHQFPSNLATGIIHHDAVNQGLTPLYEPQSVGLNCGLGEGTSSSSSSSRSLQWDLNIRAHEGIDCPSAQWGNSMSFIDLLASRNPSSVSLAQNNTSVGGDNSRNIFPGLDSQPEAAAGYTNGTMPKYQDSALNLQTAVLSGGLREQSALAPGNLQNQNNYLNSHLPAENVPVFAPPTPNPKTCEKLNTSAEVNSLTNRNTSIPNLEENSVSASSRSIDLCSVLQHATETLQPGNGVPVATGDCIHEYENKTVHGDVEVNKTTGQRPRRKKHRPKVVKESKLGRPQKPRVQKKPVEPNEPPRERRKYARKRKDNPSTPVPTPTTREGSKSLHQKAPEPRRKSSRRALNFALDDEPSADNNSPHRSTENFHSERLPARTLHGMKIHSDLDRPRRKENSVETETETVQAYSAHEFQTFQDYKSMPANENPTNLQSIRQIFTQSPNSSTCATSSKKKKASSLKRVNSPTADIANISTETTATKQFLGSGNDHIFVSENVKIFQGMSFPEIHKKKGTEKNLKPSSASSLLSAPHHDARALATDSTTPADNREEETQNGHTWAELASFNKKRSREPTSLSNQDTLTRFAGSREKLILQTKERRKYTRKKNVKASTTLPSCMEALAEVTSTKRATKRRTKGRTLAVKSIHSTSDVMNMKSGLVADRPQQSQTNIPGTLLALPWRENMSVDTIADALKQLDINQERSINSNQQDNALIPYHGGRRKEKTAIVLYQTDGTMITSVAAGDQATKRKSRARVDLDNETERVWKLLLQDINSEGINGTDEEKAKWWEEERKIFHGRVDSFIARMRLVQGDRRFSPWKGSVVDSVVGVFLTQNVSDHLSSSAFMSLAAQFPILSENVRTRNKEAVVPLVTDPEECTELDPAVATIHEIDLLEQNEVFDDKDLHDPTTTVKNGQSKDVDSSGKNQVKADDLHINSVTTKTKIGTATVQEDVRATEDISSSPHSVVSSQNSADSPCAPPARSFGQNLESNSDMENLSGANFNLNNPYTSFMELLKMAEKPQVDGAQIHTQIQSAYQDYTLTQQKSAFLGKRVEGKFGSGLPSYSERICSCYVLDGEKVVMQSIKDPENGQQGITQGQEYLMMGNLKSQTSSRENVGVIENKSPSTRRVYNEHQTAQPILDHKKSKSKPTSKSTPTQKTNKAGKGKKVQFDWDSLRREALSNGQTKERSADTMDSINWEAVRCANVEEVANTIKERGMNNVLAQRIQDFLNRLINHHGSIDLEWLRDVPPDKAKEYLLSIRGLGLKSVECVRLLTLHHLAFPVDTNVGRIAVRLGWVPLQPLPESLQLHLLELYPVLESIQKYLWPRLCKLDQTTLYELHYHMITFGKVFCTKKQPNCNACPLRGECRHFASAFARSASKLLF